MSRLQNSTASARLLTDVPSFTVSELLNRLAPGPLAALRIGSYSRNGSVRFMSCIERLLDEREIIERPLKLADHDPIDRRFEAA
jgi:hypothetical protein